MVILQYQPLVVQTLLILILITDVSNGLGIVSGSIVFSQLNNGGMELNQIYLLQYPTKDGLQDSVKIFKVEGGNGSDGTTW